MNSDEVRQEFAGLVLTQVGPVPQCCATLAQFGQRGRHAAAAMERFSNALQADVNES